MVYPPATKTATPDIYGDVLTLEAAKLLHQMGAPLEFSLATKWYRWNPDLPPGPTYKYRRIQSG